MSAPRARWVGWALNGALLVTTLAIGIAVGEVVLRKTVFDPTQSYIRTPGWTIAVRHNDLLPFVDRDHTISINRLGLRGEVPPPSASPKIAVFGGSTTEDWVLEDSATWVKRFEAALADCVPQVWAGNFGKGGVNARHHLLQIPEILPYMPKLDRFVVLMGLNDFLFDLRIHHPFELPENWWRDQALMYVAGQEGQSAVVAGVVRLYRMLTRSKSQVPASDFGHYQKWLRDAYAKVRDDQWVDELPDLTEHLTGYRDTIRKLKQAADRAGAEILFVTQPFLWSDNMSDEAKAQIFAGFIGAQMTDPATRWYTVPALEKGLAAYNETLLETCRADGLTCFDLAGALEKRAEYYYDEFHFSGRGADAVGRLVAGKMRALPGVCTR